MCFAERARAAAGWLVALLCAVPLTAGAQDAAPPAPVDLAALWKQFHLGAQLVTIYTGTEPAGTPTNPGNRVKMIEDSELDVQVRGRLVYNDPAEGVTLSVEPWLTYHLGTADPGGTEDDVDLLVAGYVVQVRDLIPRTTLTVSRQDLEWGPGFFASPSNPFTTRITTDNPLRKDPGQDYVWVSTSLTDDVALTYYYNYSSGAQEPTALAPFREAQIGVVSYFGQSFTVALLGGTQDELGGLVGSYGQWTADDALLLYYDGVVRKGSPGLYPVADPALPTGGRYEQTRKNSDRLFPEILVGAAYTTPGDYTLYAEYFYYGPGYSDGELARARRINRAAADLFGTELEGLGFQALGAAAVPNLQYVGQHFLNLQATKSFGALELAAQNALSLQDWTSRLFMSIAYAFGGYRVAATGIVFYGPAGGVLRQDLDHRFTIGVSRDF